MKDISINQMLTIVSNAEPGWLLIGATPAARALHKALGSSGRAHNIVCWTDKKYAFFARCGLPVLEADMIPWEAVEGVIVGGAMARGYANRLLANHRIDHDQVYLLTGDYTGWEDYDYPDIHYSDDAVDPSQLLLLDPVDLITEDRLDIVIRYTAACEIAVGCDGEGVQLYKQLTMSMNDGSEYVRPFTTCAYFSLYESKAGFDTFRRSLSELISSISERGFDPCCHIPLSENYGVINGTHRIAVAALLGQKVYAKRYIGYGEPFLSFRPEQLPERGFTQVQIEKILKVYYSLKSRKEV